MSKVFLSYSRADAPVAETIAKAIQHEGVSVYKDDAVLATGSNFSEQIYQAINAADMIVVLLSENTKRSRFVEQELASALEHKKMVVSVLLDKDAKNNWVWPLVADRQAIERADSESIESVAMRAVEAIRSPAQSIGAETLTRSGPTVLPSAHANLSTLLEQVSALSVTRPQPSQSATKTQPQDQIKQIISILNALTQGSNEKGLGEVNGALGQTIGNLLNGKKSAIGIIGAMFTAMLQNFDSSLPITIPPVGSWAELGSVAMPVFLAIAAWGVLGKLEKWFQSRQ